MGYNTSSTLYRFHSQPSFSSIMTRSINIDCFISADICPTALLFVVLVELSPHKDVTTTNPAHNRHHIIHRRDRSRATAPPVHAVAPESPSQRQATLHRPRCRRPALRLLRRRRASGCESRRLRLSPGCGRGGRRGGKRPSAVGGGGGGRRCAAAVR